MDMIVKVTFKGRVKKDTIIDDIKVHAESIEAAREMVQRWISISPGLRGNSGLFHPGNGYGKIKIKSVKRVKE